MLGRLKAEEQIELQNMLVAAGNRYMEDGDRRQLMRELERAMRGGRVERATPITAEVLMEMGIRMNVHQGAGPYPVKKGKEVKSFQSSSAQQSLRSRSTSSSSTPVSQPPSDA